MRLKNAEVVKNFVGRFGDCQSYTGNLYSRGNKLYNYSTVIAQYIEGELVINATKYSTSTSRIQNMVRNEAYRYIETEKYVPINTSDLKDYVKDYVPVKA